mmetsp:Transcript_43724/g.114928  ORF Transcript_43724/g.114928 Transcript_43724/m.114928 type:complete len:264 (+) Transcript_43724:352-1143(+)
MPIRPPGGAYGCMCSPAAATCASSISIGALHDDLDRRPTSACNSVPLLVSSVKYSIIPSCSLISITCANSSFPFFGLSYSTASPRPNAGFGFSVWVVAFCNSAVEAATLGASPSLPLSAFAAAYLAAILALRAIRLAAFASFSSSSTVAAEGLGSSAVDLVIFSVVRVVETGMVVLALGAHFCGGLWPAGDSRTDASPIGCSRGASSFFTAGGGPFGVCGFFKAMTLTLGRALPTTSITHVPLASKSNPIALCLFDADFFSVN